MKKSDFMVVTIVLSVVCAMAFWPPLTELYNNFNREHGLWMSFIKFALLATFGESLALRLRSGQYNAPGFGLIPRAIVWGFLGLTIKMAFVIFSSGTPAFLAYMGFSEAGITLKSGISLAKLGVAFSISTAMNLIYAPVMMTLHKITDMHIQSTGGSISGLFSPIEFRKHFNSLDWDRQWNFVFKKTIPFFWIPAHTITFLLPEQIQVLFAALLGIALGILLSLSGKKK